MKAVQIKFFTAFIFVLAASVFGQNGAGSVGHINLKINSNDTNLVQQLFDVPVNEKAPILRGDEIKSEQSGTGNIWTFTTLAVQDKNDREKALLTVRIIARNDGKTKNIVKKIKIKRGEKKIFIIKYQDYYYDATAFYEPLKLS